MLIKKYTSNWIKEFELIKNEIHKVIQPPTCTIEHVGSTAVPNLDAKPIIDIDIIYHNNNDLLTIKQGLQQLGYYHNGNQGIEHREVFKRSGLFRNNILDSITHHLYVCLANTPALERHILIRNFLRKNEWARVEYQQMKYKLAEQANQDKKTYANLKELYTNGFIDEIIQQEKLNQKNALI